MDVDSGNVGAGNVDPGSEGGEGEPRYRQVAADLRGMILDGRLAPEAVLPTQQNLRRRYGIGRGTVQSALQLLRDEGLVEEGVPGRAARIARPGVTLQPLGHHIARAFAAQHVRLDVWAQTAEQLSKAVQVQTEAIQAGEFRPESVVVRVLLPDLETRHPYPCGVDDPDDPRPLQRLRHLIRTYAGAMEHSLMALEEEHLVESVRVEIRGLPTIPGEKRYIINGSEILTGFYQIRRCHMHNIGDDGGSLDVLDLYSDGSLFPLNRERSPGGAPARAAASLDEARFEQITQWFETRWDHVAQPLPLQGEL